MFAHAGHVSGWFDKAEPVSQERPEASKPERRQGGPSPFLTPSSCALMPKLATDWPAAILHLT
jgi:hypothetical protein